MIRKLFAILLLTLFATTLAVAVLLQTAPVRSWIAEEVQARIYDQTGLTVTFDEFEVEFPLRFTVTGISTADSEVVIDRFSGTLNPVALFQGAILIHNADIEYGPWSATGSFRVNPTTDLIKGSLTVTSATDSSLELTLQTRLYGLQGPLHLSGKWEEHSAQLTGRLALSEKGLRYSSLQGAVDTVTIGGELCVDPSLNLDRTKLNLGIDQVTATAHVRGRYDAIEIDYAAFAPHLDALTDIRSEGSLSFTEGEINGLAITSFTVGGGRAHTTTELFWSPQLPATLTVTGKAPLSDRFRLEATLPIGESYWQYALKSEADDLTFEAAGNARSESVKVMTFVGKWNQYPFKLAEPFSFNRASVSPLALKFGDGTLLVRCSYDDAAVSIDAKVDNLPLQLLPPFNEQLPALGTFGGALKLQGPPQRLEGKAEFEMRQMKLQDPAFAHTPELNGSATATLTGETLKLNVHFTGLAQTPIRLDAVFPAYVSVAPPRVYFNPDKPFSTQLTYEGPVGPLTELITTETAPLKGELQLEITAEGSLSHPELSGSGSFRNGSYESIATGVVLKGIEADFKGEGESIRIERMAARTRGNGTIAGSGSLQMNAADRYPFELNLDLTDANIVRVDWMNGNATGAVTLKGNVEEATLSGALRAYPLIVSIPERSAASIKVVDVTYVNQPEDEAPPTLVTHGPPRWPIHLDIALDTEYAEVRGEELSTSWQGAVNVVGTLADFKLKGDVHTIEGRYLFNGRPFDITQGTIAFNGDPLKEAVLYVVAEQDLGDITAEVVVKGPLNDLAIALRSKPALPQREVLSWILFGRGTSDITNFESEELTKSISDLNTSRGPDMLTQIRSQMGIDRIDFNRDPTGKTNEMSVQVGKYISKGVLVSVNKGINNDANRVGIEANLMRNIKLEAEVGDNAEGHLFLKWKRDY